MRRRVPLGDDPRELTARMPRAVYEALEAEAAANGLSVNALLNRVVVDHLAPKIPSPQVERV